MDYLGLRVTRDQAFIAASRERAAELEAEARKLREKANEVERLLELARQAQ